MVLGFLCFKVCNILVPVYYDLAATEVSRVRVLEKQKVEVLSSATGDSLATQSLTNQLIWPKSNI